MRRKTRKEVRSLFTAVGLRLLASRVGRAVARRVGSRVAAAQRLAKIVHAPGPLVALIAALNAGNSGRPCHVNPLAIGRVDQHDAAGGWRHALQRIATAKLHSIGHAGPLGIALGKIDHAERDIAAKHRSRGLGDGGLGLALQPFPHMGLERQVFLESKAAPDAGRDVAGDLRRLDHDGARTAAGVVQRHALFAELIPAAGGNHGGGQGFLQRGVALVFPPAALEQRLARGVDVKGDGVGGQVGVHPHVGPVGIDIGAHVVLGAKAVGNRVLDLERRKIQARQRAVLRCDLDLEALPGGEPDFPGHVARRVVEVLLAAILAVLQFDQHALGQAAVQVELHRVAPRALQLHTGAPGLALGAGDALNLGGQQRFHTGGARQE